jgi:hypothetical protein
MFARPRTLLAAALFLAAGCTASPPVAPADEVGLQDDGSPLEVSQARPRPPRVTPTPRSRRTPRPTPAPPTPPPTNPTPSNPAPPTNPTPPNPAPPTAVNDLTVYCTGQARDVNGVGWSYALRAVQQANGTIRHGQLLIVSSVQNVTLFGTLSSGTITRVTGGTGTAVLSGTLTTGQTIQVTATDACDPVNPDSLQFEVSGGPSFDGKVFCGGVRILHTRPEASGRAPAAGFGFDPRIGLFVAQADLDDEKSPPDQPLDKALIEVTRPDPIIDFRKDDVGGYTQAPGSDNNRPN